jgi:hypothetical protein
LLRFRVWERGCWCTKVLPHALCVMLSPGRQQQQQQQLLPKGVGPVRRPRAIESCCSLQNDIKDMLANCPKHMVQFIHISLQDMLAICRSLGVCCAGERGRGRSMLATCSSDKTQRADGSSIDFRKSAHGHHGPSSSRCQTALSHLKHEGLEEVHPVGDFALLTAPYQPGGLCMPFLVWHLGSPPLRQHVLQRGLPVGHGSNCCYNRDARGISLPAFMFTSPTLVFLGAHLCSHRELERGARDLHIHRQELCTLNLVCPNCVENTTRLAH